MTDDMEDLPPDPTFHPIDVLYSEAIDPAELRRAFAACLVAGMTTHVPITADRLVGLCADMNAFLAGEVPKLRAVK